MEIKTGSNLKKWRKKNHLTQKELAQKIGYSVYQISRIESGDLAVTSKLESLIIRIDKELHPLGSRIFKKINEIYENRLSYKSAERRKFESDIQEIETKMVELLNLEGIKKDKYRDYLNDVSLCLDIMLEVKDYSYVHPKKSQDKFKSLVDELKNRIKRNRKGYLHSQN